MVSFKRLYSAIEVAVKVMANWSDREDDIIDMVILPPENVDDPTDDKQIPDDEDKINNGLSNDVCGTSQFQTNIPEIEVNLSYDDDISDSEKSRKEERGIELPYRGKFHGG